MLTPSRTEPAGGERHETTAIRKVGGCGAIGGVKPDERGCLLPIGHDGPHGWETATCERCGGTKTVAKELAFGVFEADGYGAEFGHHVRNVCRQQAGFIEEGRHVGAETKESG